MIRLLKLVFDDDYAAVCILQQHVQRVPADAMFDLPKFKR